MISIIDNKTDLDRTVQIFDAFYNSDIVVGAAQYDVVRSYFVSVCETKKIADNFTAVLFRIANETGIDVLTLLKEIQGTSNNLQMNAKICYYLNGIKSKTSLYGVNVVPNPVQSVVRNVVL